MALPKPQHSLDGSCSALFNNTLFTYSATAFQSLEMENDAAWTTLDPGVPVAGGVCVKSLPQNDAGTAALYIVGGTASDPNYKGLQRYIFANQTWETISPTVPVTQGRLYHGAVYLNASDAILVFAGTQDGNKQLSSQTFTIQAKPPFAVRAYEAGAPPAISPILVPWTEDKAMYMGGSETNRQVMVFSPSNSWMDSKATLANPVPNFSNVKAIVMDGKDGSKHVYTFDMTVLPNTVKRTVLIDGSGSPVQNAAPVGEKSPTERRQESTTANWPAYNGTLAPNSIRTSFSIAKDQNGMVVISGGNDEDVLAIFDAAKNTWINTSAKVGMGSDLRMQSLENISSLTTTSTTKNVSSTAPVTASGSADTLVASAAVGASGHESSGPSKILGAVVGGVAGFALILVAMLAFLRWRKRKKHAASHQRDASGFRDEKNGMDFADRGLPYPILTPHFPGHEPSASQGSTSSIAILMGRAGYVKGEKAAIGSESKDHNINNNYQANFSAPMPQESAYLATRNEKANPFADAAPPPAGAPVPRPRQTSKSAKAGTARRSSGWNRYWSGGSSLNILGFGSKRSTYEGSDRSSDCSLDPNPFQGSAVVPPLNVGDRTELNRVMSGSPTVQSHTMIHPMTGEMSGNLERSESFTSAASSSDDRHDAFSSGSPASVTAQQNAWTPVDETAGWNNRDSNYSESVYAPTVVMNTPKIDNDRMTRFPGAEQPAPPASRGDMSWLNLGGNSRV